MLVGTPIPPALVVAGEPPGLPAAPAPPPPPPAELLATHPSPPLFP